MGLTGARLAKKNNVKARSRRRRSTSKRSIVDVDQQEVTIVARAPHEEVEVWQSMSVDDLWRLHEGLVAAITEKIQAEKSRLEARLKQLSATSTSVSTRFKATSPKEAKARRPYPEVKPKFRDSSDPSVTWSGRGKLPRWLTEHLKSGKKLEDFKID
jgi:DNA-binding protein H-NS